jgi:hypothetical protein
MRLGSRVPLKEAPMPDAPRRILVIANETCASPAVCEEVRYRAGGAGAEVLVVAPTLARSRLGHWLSADDHRAREAAEERLASSVAALKEAGLDARGRLGDGDPLLALDDAFRIFAPHEVIISTHPPARSQWLERRIVPQARERYPVPVTHIVVDVELEDAQTHRDSRDVGARPPAGARLRLYHHASSYDDALTIAEAGFGPGVEVPLTDRPLDHGHDGPVGLQIDVPEDVAAGYERPAEGRREFVVPGGVLNRYGPAVVAGDWSE